MLVKGLFKIPKTDFGIFATKKFGTDDFFFFLGPLLTYLKELDIYLF